MPAVKWHPSLVKSSGWQYFCGTCGEEIEDEWYCHTCNRPFPWWECPEVNTKEPLPTAMPRSTAPPVEKHMPQITAPPNVQAAREVAKAQKERDNALKATLKKLPRQGNLPKSFKQLFNT